MQDYFRRMSEATANAVGTPAAFLLAVVVVLIWGITGPIFAFSDTWQLVINTGTTIITFLMVFLIQSTQNRDTRILNLKLDELIRGVEGARTGFVGLNDLSDEDLEHVQTEFKTLGGKFAPLVQDDLEAIDNEQTRRKLKRR